MRVTYSPEMPQSTAMSTHSWLKSSATVRHLMRRPVLRLSLTKSMLQTSLTARATCSGARSDRSEQAQKGVGRRP